MERKKLKTEKFLDEMEKVVPWDILIAVIKPYYTESTIGRTKTDLLMLLKIYFLQQWYNLSDPGAEEAIYDRNSFQKFLNIDLLSARIPDETTILNFRHLLEQNELSEKFFNAVNGSLSDKGLLMRRGTLVDATIIVASSSTKNESKKRDPEMSSTKKGANYSFGMKAHTGTDMESGLVHTLTATTASEHDIEEFENLLHGDEEIVGGDKG
jgi:IS5 family transposase